jgi:osmotically-inducible protein OsmY
MRTRAARTLAVIGLGVSCACAELPPPAPPAAAAVDVAGPDDVAPSAAGDARVFRTLIRELDRDPVLGRVPVHVSVDLGVVTLEGRVAHRLAKERAVEVAGVVKGVRAIIDRIAVMPEPRADGELELDVAVVLSTDPVTTRQRIAVRALNDVIHLSGDVDSMGTRRIAERDVLAVPGVLGVQDDLAVRPEHVSDEELAATVSRIVRDDPWLDASSVRVTARGGIVALAGQVPSGAERARAEYDARAAAPWNVDLSLLQIDPVFHDDGTLRASGARAPNDLEIAEALGEAFILDPRVYPFAPTVRVRDRVVVLTGVAPNRAALRAAEQDARDAPGVANVRDDLKERASVVKEDDDALRSDVAATIAGDPYLGLLHIAVDAHRGRVVLRGAVPTEIDRVRVVSLASCARGAVDVDDTLVVKQTGLATDARPGF